MAETYKKAGELDSATYKRNLIVIVSDPDIPDSPTKESKKLTLGDISSNFYSWNPTTAINTITGLKATDFLTITGVTGYHQLSPSVTVKNDDVLLVVSLSPVTLFLIKANTERSREIVYVSNANSPYNAAINTDIFIDASTGPVTINLPTVHGTNESVNLIPNGGRYEVNPVTIQATDPIEGTVETVSIDVDNLLVSARWVGLPTGYIFISK